MNEDGTLTFTTSVFDEVLETDEAALVAFFTDEDTGFVAQSEARLTGYTQVNGILDSKTDGYQVSIDRLDEEIDSAEEDLLTTEERLRTYYTTLESTLSELQNTQTALESLLAQFDN